MGNNYDKYENGACRFCGKEPADENIKSSNPSDKQLGSYCFELKNLGEKLPLITKIAFSNKKIENKDFLLPPVTFFDDRYFVYFFGEKNSFKEEDYSSIFSLNENDVYPLKLISNYIPREGNSNLSFEQISQKSCLSDKFEFAGNNYKNSQSDPDVNTDNTLSSNEMGQEMMGVFRADVDNMGFIFSYGLENQNMKKSNLTISRYYSMSRMFNIFFNGFLKKQLKNNANFKNIYTVYSGGDDLFLIGPWDSIVDFAIIFQKKFKEYTCFNSDVTISGAVGLFKPNFPVKRFAFKTGELLKSAKDGNMKNKTEDDFKLHGDRISLFNKNVSWEDAEILIKEGLFLENELKKNKFSKNSKITSSFLYRLFQYYRMWEKYNETGKVEWIRYRPLLAYDIARNIIEKNNHEIKNKEVIDRIYKLMESDNIKNLVIPLSWAIYRTRKR